jgi:hypothetical protein
MDLQHKQQLDSIENCPLDNEKGVKTLFRCVENPITPKSFEPLALQKGNLKKNCLAWGLSMFDDLNSAKETLENLSQNKRRKVRFQSIATSTITDSDGVKHCSCRKSHYTFYPNEGLDLIGRFALVENQDED